MLGCLLTLALAAEGEFAAPERAPADSWPSFRGVPAMTGASAGTLADKPVQKWSKRFPGEVFEAGAALADGVAFVCSMQGTVRALSLADGAERWKFELPEVDKLRPGCKGNPLIVGEHVVLAGDLGLVMCLERATGKPVWKKLLDTNIGSAPSLARGAVLIAGEDGSIECLDAKTGDRRWQFPPGEKILGSPGLVGDYVLTSGCDGVVRLVGIKDGKVAKEYAVKEQHIASTPAVAGRHVYFGTMEGAFCCLDWHAMKLVWENPPPEADEAKREFFSSPALAEDVVVVGARDKKIYAFDRKTGKERWAFATKAHVDASPLIAGGRAYVGSEDRRFYALDLATGKEAWQRLAGGKFGASAALAAGRLVVPDRQGNIHCFGAE